MSVLSVQRRARVSRTAILAILVVATLVLVAGILTARVFLYFGPDPAPFDYHTDLQQLAFEIADLESAPENNGWPHFQAALEALDLAKAATFADDRILASETVENIRERRTVSEEGRTLFAEFRAQSAAVGLFDALERLAAAPGSATMSPYDPISSEAIDARGSARELIRYLVTLVIDAETRGEPEEVVRFTRYALALAEAQTSEPHLIPYLTEVAMAQLMFDTVHEVLAEGTLDKNALLELHRTLADFKLPIFVDMLRGEKIVKLQMLSTVTRNGIMPKMFSRGYHANAVETSFDRWTEIAQLPSSERTEAASAFESQSARLATSTSISGLVTPVMQKPLLIADLIEMAFAAVRLHAAIEAYTAVHSTPPQALTDLVPEFFDALPTDPRGPGGIVYTLIEDPAAYQGRTYLLYAVGFDGIDNAGSSVPDGSLHEVYTEPGDPDHDYLFNQPPLTTTSGPP